MVDILLSTYNGEKYLSEQIDSILNQTYKDWHLLIRDDGSVDETISIISKYVSKYPNKITWINKEDVRNVGVIRSFEALMKESTSPCFMFCDQDDVWLPNKIEQTLKVLQQHEKKFGVETPLLVHTDLNVVDKDLNEIHHSFFKMSRFNPTKIHSNIHFSLMYNCVTGCTVMGNEKARKISLPIEEWADMHDSWVTRKVLLNAGKVITIPNPTMLYRQHGKNVLGSNHQLTIRGRILYLYSIYRQYKKLLPKYKFIAVPLFIYWRFMYRF
jgi:glycosyltransferase involved in cell wall biosynthesis